jgi:hypothetical protein
MVLAPRHPKTFLSLVPLSKSLFVAGVQCHRLLWWKVHEPLAKELQPDKVLQDRFDQGAQVGALARDLFPNGLLIEAVDRAHEDRIRLTQDAIGAGTPAIFEATFEARGVRVKVDVLLRDGDGWRLIEVKSSSSQKDEHFPDAAVQLFALEACGVPVTAVEIMHLSKDFRHPDQGELLVRTDVTDAVRALQAEILPRVSAQLAMLDGPLPEVAIGEQCEDPRPCPFVDRCWPDDPNHIRKLYNVGVKRAAAHMRAGVHSVWDLPPRKKPNFTEQRQLKAMKEGRLIVEPTLARALEEFSGRLGFLDFETISRAVPVWPGMSPWSPAPAQFSYHEAVGNGGYTHSKFLAEGPEDCRPELARQMVEATAKADRIVTYSAYEKTQIRALQQSVPSLRAELEALEYKLIDLLPVVRENVYHPEFHGSFSIKYVLGPMVPGLTYDDLVIVNGLVASVEIARLLFVSQKIPYEERDRVRKDLLDYCERDTWAMVKLLERLRHLSINAHDPQS